MKPGKALCEMVTVDEGRSTFSTRPGSRVVPRAPSRRRRERDRGGYFDNLQSAICNLQSISNQQSAISNQQSAISNQ